MYQIYMIFLNGFALFGLYCFVDTLLSVLYASKMPPTVTVFSNSQDDKTFKKVKYVENCVPNNYNVLYPFDNVSEDEQQCRILDEYIKNVLIVNKR